jgi:hypothetical protein
MTNTLHRDGDARSFADDYIVIAIPSRGKNDKNAVLRLKRFLELALPVNPVNLGDARHGGALRPCKSLNPTVHWKRDSFPIFDDIINVSTSIEQAERKRERLPNEDVLTLSTMCGHGMVSASFAKKMIDWVKEGRRSPRHAASYMARFCSCAIFNTSRAARVLERARSATR